MFKLSDGEVSSVGNKNKTKQNKPFENAREWKKNCLETLTGINPVSALDSCDQLKVPLSTTFLICKWTVYKAWSLTYGSTKQYQQSLDWKHEAKCKFYFLFFVLKKNIEWMLPVSNDAIKVSFGTWSVVCAH